MPTPTSPNQSGPHGRREIECKWPQGDREQCKAGKLRYQQEI